MEKNKDYKKLWQENTKDYNELARKRLDDYTKGVENSKKIDVLEKKIDEIELDDAINEIADNNIPIYTYDLLQYASNNFDLIQQNDLAGDNPDVIKIIQANMYDILTEELYGYVSKIQDNKKETGKE